MRKICIFLLLAVFLLSTGCQGTQPEIGELTATVNGKEVIFQPWEQDGLPTEGSYYLTKPVKLTETVHITAELNLHFNGQAVTVADKVAMDNMLVVDAGAKLALCGFDGEGGLVAPRSINAKVTVISMIRLSGELVLEGTTVNAAGIALEDKGNGMAIYMCSGAELTMNSGMIIGGYTERSKQNPPDGVWYGQGGSIYMEPGTSFCMNGGEIRSGSASRGGNIYIQSTKDKPSKMLMTGGVIRGGEVTDHGGNIWLERYGAFAMLGGEICEGKALYNWRIPNTPTNGANFRVSNPDSVFIMAGGRMHGGETYNYATNISNYGSTLYLIGGELEEGIYHNLARSDPQGIWCYTGSVSTDAEEAEALLQSIFGVSLNG